MLYTFYDIFIRTASWKIDGIVITRGISSPWKLHFFKLVQPIALARMMSVRDALVYSFFSSSSRCVVRRCAKQDRRIASRRNSLRKCGVTNANHQWLTSADTFVVSKHYDAAHDFSIAHNMSERHTRALSRQPRPQRDAIIIKLNVCKRYEG